MKSPFLGLFSACVCATQAYGVELLNLNADGHITKVELGGYAKVDVRHVNGDIAYQDYWVANFPGGRPIETSHTGFNVRESRLSFRVQYDDVSGYVEIDSYGGGGNEVVSNSSNPRLRHFYISYKNWRVGQDWSTFMPLHALPESLDFGGPHVGEVFIRETQVRYTAGNWQFAIENPETNGDGDIGTPASAVGLSGDEADPDESIPDAIIRYNYRANWGQLSVAALARQIDQGGLDEFGAAFNIAGKINSIGKDDFRFQVTMGEAGRYVAAGLTPDIVENPISGVTQVEETTAFALAYRHFWNETLRSTLYYGAAKTDILQRERSHWGLNLVQSVTTRLDVGVELGEYAIDDQGLEAVSSHYFQASAKFRF